MVYHIMVQMDFSIERHYLKNGTVEESEIQPRTQIYSRSLNIVRDDEHVYIMTVQDSIVHCIVIRDSVVLCYS